MLKTNNMMRTLFGDKPITLVREEERISSLRDRQQFDCALRANTAIQRLLMREANEHDLLAVSGEGFLTATAGTTQMDVFQMEWLCLGGKGEAFSIQDLLFSEDMYLREEVSADATLKVPNIPLRPQAGKSLALPVMTTTKTGLWQVSESQLEWSERIVQELKLVRETRGNPSYQDVFPIFYRNREWVNDDSLLIARASQIAAGKTSCSLLLVSGDKRLARAMARTTSLTVVLVSPVIAARNARRTVYDAEQTMSVTEVIGFEAKRNLLSSEFPPVYDEVLIDTGSLSAACQRLDVDSDDGQVGKTYWSSQLVRTGNIDGTRYEVLEQEKISERDAGFTVDVLYKNGEHRKARIEPRIPTAGFDPLRRTKAAFGSFLKKP
jgi:hypothetical protein